MALTVTSEPLNLRSYTVADFTVAATDIALVHQPAWTSKDDALTLDGVDAYVYDYTANNSKQSNTLTLSSPKTPMFLPMDGYGTAGNWYAVLWHNLLANDDDGTSALQISVKVASTTSATHTILLGSLGISTTTTRQVLQIGSDNLGLLMASSVELNISVYLSPFGTVKNYGIDKVLLVQQIDGLSTQRSFLTLD